MYPNTLPLNGPHHPITTSEKLRSLIVVCEIKVAVQIRGEALSQLSQFGVPRSDWWRLDGFHARVAEQAATHKPTCPLPLSPCIY